MSMLSTLSMPPKRSPSLTMSVNSQIFYIHEPFSVVLLSFMFNFTFIDEADTNQPARAYLLKI